MAIAKAPAAATKAADNAAAELVDPEALEKIIRAQLPIQVSYYPRLQNWIIRYCLTASKPLRIKVPNVLPSSRYHTYLDSHLQVAKYIFTNNGIPFYEGKVPVINPFSGAMLATSQRFCLPGIGVTIDTGNQACCGIALMHSMSFQLGAPEEWEVYQDFIDMVMKTAMFKGGPGVFRGSVAVYPSMYSNGIAVHNWVLKGTEHTMYRNSKYTDHLLYLFVACPKQLQSKFCDLDSGKVINLVDELKKAGEFKMGYNNV